MCHDTITYSKHINNIINYDGVRRLHSNNVGRFCKIIRVYLWIIFMISHYPLSVKEVIITSFSINFELYHN